MGAQKYFCASSNFPLEAAGPSSFFKLFQALLGNTFNFEYFLQRTSRFKVSERKKILIRPLCGAKKAGSRNSAGRREGFRQVPRGSRPAPGLSLSLRNRDPEKSSSPYADSLAETDPCHGQPVLLPPTLQRIQTGVHIS